MPDKLEKQLQFMEAHKEYPICFTAASLIDAEDNDVTDECIEMRDSFGKQYGSQKECIQFLFKNKNTLCHPSGLVRKKVIDRVGGFNLMFCQLADYDLWMRIITEGPIYVMPERLIKFRWDMKSKDQISIATTENAIRAFNEQVLIKKHFMERISDEKLIEFFSDQFRNKNSRSHLELEFERAFLLMDCLNETRELKVLGMEKLEQIMREPEAMQVLREHFGLDVFDLYAWNKGNMYQTPWSEDRASELKMEELRLTVNHYRNLMAQLEQEREMLQARLDEMQRIHSEDQERHKTELELTVNHYRNLMAQLEQEKEMLQTRLGEMQRVHCEDQERHKTELELTVNHYHNLMAQLEQEKETLQSRYDEMQKAIMELQQSTMEMQQTIAEKEELIYAYANSISWKITEPFRRFMRMLKK